MIKKRILIPIISLVLLLLLFTAIHVAVTYYLPDYLATKLSEIKEVTISFDTLESNYITQRLYFSNVSVQGTLGRQYIDFNADQVTIALSWTSLVLRMIIIDELRITDGTGFYFLKAKEQADVYAQQQPASEKYSAHTVSSWFVPTAEAADGYDVSDNAWPILINTVTMEHIALHYVHEIRDKRFDVGVIADGTVEHLFIPLDDSTEPMTADVQLVFPEMEGGAAYIRAALHSLAPQLNADFSVELEHYDISTLNPYLYKVPFTVIEGNGDYVVSGQIINDILQSQHEVLIHHARVEHNPEAPTYNMLPENLQNISSEYLIHLINIIANNGLTLRFPVNGNVASGEFSYWASFGEAFKNSLSGRLLKDLGKGKLLLESLGKSLSEFSKPQRGGQPITGQPITDDTNTTTTDDSNKGIGDAINSLLSELMK